KTQITIDFECQPGIRGDRLTLQNFVANPGFEAPCGGASAPAPIVFSDTFANVSAYLVQSGSAPTLSPANTYVDILLANATSLLRYYRLDEASGTSAYDISGAGQTGTYTGGITLSVAGGISGDTDTAVSLNGSTGYVSVPVSGMPTANSPIAFGLWFKFAANPGAISVLQAYGAGGAHNYIQLYLDTSGKLNADTGATLATTASALTTGVWHFGVVSWDGTTLSLLVDGAAAVTSTPGAQTIPTSSTVARVGANAASSVSQFFNGQVDEPFWQAAVMTSTQAAAIYTAGHSGATGTLSGAMSIATGSQVTFGNPTWNAVQMWSIPFRFVTGAQPRVFLHYVDGSDYLQIQVTSSALTITHRVAGTSNVLATVTLPGLTHEAWYWLQVTQFPSVAGDYPEIQAALLWDSLGVPGAQVAMAGPVAAADPVIALTGKAVLLAQSAALTLGGLVGTTQRAHSLALFGPGGWLFSGELTGVSNPTPSSGAWEQTAANTIPVGTSALVPVTSFGAARIDLGPVGAVDAAWLSYNGGASAAPINGIPATQNQAFGLSAYVKAPLLSGTASTRIIVSEYNSSGTFLTSGVAGAALTGAIASWTQIVATYTVSNASTAYIGVQLRTTDATVGASANATVWWDNVQCWNQTTTGQTSMPYCELRFLSSPAQLVVSGLLGDMPARAFLAFGTHAVFNAGQSFSFFLGQRGNLTNAGPGARLITPSVHPNNAATILLDSLSYGGYATQVGGFNGAFVDAANGLLAQLPDANGVYHFLLRAKTTQSAGNLSKVQALLYAGEQDPANPTTGGFDIYAGPLLTPFTVSNQWQTLDLGQVKLPLWPRTSLMDTSKFPVNLWVGINDTNASAGTYTLNWHMLLPVDGLLLMATIANSPSGASYAATWFWYFTDGLTLATGKPPAWMMQPWTAGSYGIVNTGAPSPTYAVGGAGSTAAGLGGISITPTSDPYLVLDPSQSAGSSGGSGVNQLVGLLTDNLDTVLPLCTEITYSPLYLYPR
ncbi:MAG TPA: LamG domain-containing protein, partial [Ktedonobacterales bacterium]|nr:LamG domain-containing protein [Ktedonobacterales bacterium]